MHPIVNKYGIFTYAADASDADSTDKKPKNETLAEHMEHCEAKPGNCPFEKKAASSAENEDVVEAAAAPVSPAASAEPSAPDVPAEDPNKALNATAVTLEAAISSAAKSVSPNFLNPDSFSVTPSYTWDADAKAEVPTGGFQITAAVNGGTKDCNGFLDKLHKVLGISRKHGDFSASDEDGVGRIRTHVTPEEASAALKHIEVLKKKAAEAAKKAAAEAAAKAKSAEQMKTLALTTALITSAAKDVNHHVSQGDFAPSKSLLDAAMNTKDDVTALASSDVLGEKGKKQAEALLTALGEIEASYYGGKHNKVSKVPQWGDAKPKAAQKPSAPLPAEQKPVAAPASSAPSAPPSGASAGVSAPLPTAAQVSDLYHAILNGAKTINYHIDKGDFTPNESKISALMEAGKQLHAICPNGKSDHPFLNSLCKTMGEIGASAKNGFQTKIGMVKPFTPADAQGLAEGSPDDASSAPFTPKPPTNGGFISPLDQILNGSLSGHAAQKPGNGEAPDAYDYDPDRWAFMKSDKSVTYCKDAADALSKDDAVKILSDAGYLVAENGSKDMVANGVSAYHATHVRHGHAPLKNAQVREDTIKCAAAALKDLQDRFPNMAKCHAGIVYPSKAKSSGTAAEWVKNPSDVDASTICFHADYNSPDIAFAGSFSYGHKDARYPFDIFRHEYMHGIATGAVAKEWKKFVGDNYGYPATGFFKLMKQKVSDYAAYQSNIYESIAEIFSKMTSHDYVPGTLPRKIEDFMYTKVLGVEQPESHPHLMYDPAKGKPSIKPNAAQTAAPTAAASENATLADFASWFAPSAPATHEAAKPAPVLAEAKKVKAFQPAMMAFA